MTRKDCTGVSPYYNNEYHDPKYLDRLVERIANGRKHRSWAMVINTDHCKIRLHILFEKPEVYEFNFDILDGTRIHTE